MKKYMGIFLIAMVFTLAITAVLDEPETNEVGLDGYSTSMCTAGSSWDVDIGGVPLTYGAALWCAHMANLY